MRARVEFPNGYEASVVLGPGSYGSREGLFEVAVLYKGKLNYNTPITDDTLGNLTPQEVEKVLIDIENLPEKT